VETLITPKELRQILRLGHTVVYRLLASGSIPVVFVTDGRRRRSFRVRPVDLEKWLLARRVSKS